MASATRSVWLTESLRRRAARRRARANAALAEPLAGSHSPSPVSTRRRRGPTRPFPRGDWDFFPSKMPLRFIHGRLGPRGNSRNGLGARGGNSLGRVRGPTGGDSLAPLAPSPLARRPRRARLAPATCARRGRLALAPLPRASPLPLRPLPI